MELVRFRDRMQYRHSVANLRLLTSIWHVFILGNWKNNAAHRYLAYMQCSASVVPIWTALL